MNKSLLKIRVVAARVLVVDDHARARESMAEILRQAGHEVQCCASASEALQLLARASYDVVLTDLQMPGMSGLELIVELEKRRTTAQVVMVTAYASVATAVEAMRHGAFDYIEKPFDVDQLESLIARALVQANQGGKRATTPAATGETGPAMIGDSPAMRKLRQLLAQIGPTDETVLITGESGTGKELVARFLHSASQRAGGPFVGLNCPALSPNLMESELFGHERGAFTSADAPRVGRFELAHRGTLLLDEVTEIELPLQAKLLRVLQERRYERVGSSQSRDADVRVVATTNRRLRDEVSAGRFREDLYFRLAVVPVQAPALRERPEDVPQLAEHFLRQAALRLRREPCVLETDALELLLNYRWPGNVRELENLMTRATVLTNETAITAPALRAWLGEAVSPLVNAGASLADSADLETMERRMI
jgi:DNA-binding NtrC family response regulator